MSLVGHFTRLERKRVQLSQNNPLNGDNLVTGICGMNSFEGRKWYSLDEYHGYLLLRSACTPERFNIRRVGC